MSNMPGDEADRQQGNRQGTVGPDVPTARNEPRYEESSYTQTPYGRPAYGEPTYGRLRVVPEPETRVTGRRIVQYIIDYILAGIIPALAYWLFDRSSGTLHSWGWLVATVISLAAYFVYWVVIPYAHRGQTFGMQLLRIHVIGKNGQKASMAQLFVRGIFLIVDTLFFGLVGLITILASRHRQRVGDHAAKTVVVPIRYGPEF
jgi:uncharacterized RDD family membrane protein YckC